MLCWCDKTVVDCWSNYPKPPSKATCPHPHADKKPSPAPKKPKTIEKPPAEVPRENPPPSSTMVLFASSWYYVPMQAVKWLFG